jgi:non-canonical (house-cleaning) NTP pyrophosphatase
MKKKIHIAIGSKNPCKIDSVKTAFHKVFREQLQGEEYELVFSGHGVPSNVSDQPIGDDETLLGAKNRALGALEAAQILSNENEGDVGVPDFGVGLEGGIEIKIKNKRENDNGNVCDIAKDDSEKELWCMAYMAIVGTNNSICTVCKHDSSTHVNNVTDKVSPSAKIKSSKETDEKSESELQWGISKTAAFKLPQKISNLVLHEDMELGHADDLVFNRINSKHGSGTVGVLTNNLITRSDYYDHALVLALISFIWPEHYSM